MATLGIGRGGLSGHPCGLWSCVLVWDEMEPLHRHNAIIVCNGTRTEKKKRKEKKKNCCD